MSKLEGYLLKKNGSAFRNDWRKRYFVCDGDRLAWYDDSDPRFEGAAGKPKGVVFVGADATFKPVPSKRIPHRFLLTARKAHGSKATKALDLAADSIDDLARWERALTGAGAPLPADAPEHVASVRSSSRLIWSSLRATKASTWEFSMIALHLQTMNTLWSTKGRAACFASR